MQTTLDAMEEFPNWTANLFTTPDTATFSFLYDGKPSSELLKKWKLQREMRKEDEQCAEEVFVWTDQETGLEVRSELTRFSDFHAVEWLLYFRNTGETDTPIISDILPLSLVFALPGEKACRVHSARGSECRMDDFAPQVNPMGPGGENPQGSGVGEENPMCLQSHGGRSSNGQLPFFNLEMNGKGVIGAIGWTGDWAARFWRGKDGEVYARAGMKQTHLKLLPGEEIRGPRILLMFWDGDLDNAHNRLRRFILSHHTPHPDGKPLQPPISFATWGENHAERQIAKARWFVENDVPITNYWIDAGWHGNGTYKDNATVLNSAWGEHVGNWWPNATAYPNGLKPVGDAVRSAGKTFTLWFEPERVYRETQFTREHPEWLLGPRGDNYLFNLGIPEARAAITDLISSVISEGNISCYRQDFNMDPAPFWKAADAPDRVGMSEIRHIEGLYAFWDALLERHPGLFIDNCASGGRRIDLETISRSIPLWRSDYQCYPNFDPIGMQGQTHGLSLWVPLSTGCCDHPDTYAFRSALGPGIVMFTQVNESGVPEGFHTPWDAYSADWLRTALQEQQTTQAYFQGDFYALVSYSLTDDVWAVWQFDRPDLGEGMVLALRRQHSPYPQMNACLRGLDSQTMYEVRDVDGDTTQRLTGESLLSSGMPIEIKQQLGSRLFIYKRMT